MAVVGSGPRAGPASGPSLRFVKPAQGPGYFFAALCEGDAFVAKGSVTVLLLRRNSFMIGVAWRYTIFVAAFVRWQGLHSIRF